MRRRDHEKPNPAAHHARRCTLGQGSRVEIWEVVSGVAYSPNRRRSASVIGDQLSSFH
jgi:hypothetical protein